MLSRSCEPILRVVPACRPRLPRASPASLTHLSLSFSVCTSRSQATGTISKLRGRLYRERHMSPLPMKNVSREEAHGCRLLTPALLPAARSPLMLYTRLCTLIRMSTGNSR
ncbi:hypothetical protein FKP32DRAFT_1289944 [Trametes sanguinea]|nr:hypothetical protein FKP32DRAFT_1289944 [Trametes sanguinea]